MTAKKINSILEKLNMALDDLDNHAKKYNELYHSKAASYLNDIYRDLEDIHNNLK